jgi:prepilin signal peptidase PulO-like enzyme (type II secretory pathway)
LVPQNTAAKIKETSVSTIALDLSSVTAPDSTAQPGYALGLRISRITSLLPVASKAFGSVAGSFSH